MTTLALRYKTIHHKLKSASLPRLRINWKITYALGMIFLFSMLVFYIFQINELTKGAYLIKNYNREIDQLSLQNKTLKASYASSGFLEGVQERVHAMGFQKTSDIRYIQILESQFASAR